jgi:phosphoribosyl 1,2-cyclic phosphodiesterase
MQVTFWGTRGSIATSGSDTERYGGDTSCVVVHGPDPGHLVVLDAGSGIRRLGLAVGPEVEHIDLLLSHLHLDHIVGLGFFEPLFQAGRTITIWGPPAAVPLVERLGRYLSPPLFPVRLRDLACDLELHDATEAPFSCGAFTIRAAPLIHPDSAVGYRIEAEGQALAYLPDHEPALSPRFPLLSRWTSGSALARAADLLVHDAQYSPDEYDSRVGWGHSSVLDAVAFAELVGAGRLALFHHDPAHDDEQVNALLSMARSASRTVSVVAAMQGGSLSAGG